MFLTSHSNINHILVYHYIIRLHFNLQSKFLFIYFRMLDRRTGFRIERLALGNASCRMVCRSCRSQFHGCARRVSRHGEWQVSFILLCWCSQFLVSLNTQNPFASFTGNLYTTFLYRQTPIHKTLCFQTLLPGWQRQWIRVTMYLHRILVGTLLWHSKVSHIDDCLTADIDPDSFWLGVVLYLYGVIGPEYGIASIAIDGVQLGSINCTVSFPDITISRPWADPSHPHFSRRVNGQTIRRCCI